MKISDLIPQSPLFVARRARALTTALCLAFSGAALAQGAPSTPPAAPPSTAAPNAATDGPMHGGMHGPMGPMGPMGPGMMHHHMERALKHLRAELKLTDAQSAQWDAAVQKMEPSPDAMKAMHEHHREVMAELKSADFDPHRWADEMDKLHAEHEAHMKDVRAAWLSVWDGLDAGQRTRVREFLMHMHHMDHGHRGPRDGQDSGPAAPGSAAPAK